MRSPQPIDPQTGKPLPFYNLDVVAKFPILTRSAFKSLYLVDAPEFDYSKPIKAWRDPAANPGNLNRREFLLYTVAFGQDGQIPLPDKDGYFEPTDTGLTSAEAWAVNIPPDIGLGTTPGSTPTKTVRMPIELLPNERLQQGPWGGNIRVRRLDVPLEAQTPTPAAGGFGEGDRALLIAIAKRVGVV